MFPSDRLAAIFGNIEDIHEFSRKFLADLQKHIVAKTPEMSQLGTCFLTHVCIVYCNSPTLYVINIK